MERLYCQATGFEKAWDAFWTAVVATIKRHNVTFVGGDFNMALFKVVGTLAARGIKATFLGSYAWRQSGGGSGRETARFDSLGLFAVKKVSTVARLITMPSIHGHGDVQLHEFENAQGYPWTSYLGGDAAIRASFSLASTAGKGTRGSGAASSRAGPAAATATGDDEEEFVLPHIKQKAIVPEVWDAPGGLRGRGAHMPLLFYVGDRSHRSSDRLCAREQKMIQRGWGPSSENRKWHMAHMQK